jgi:hypothetical protein
MRDGTLVNEVVEAVLYEGYILYPYRPSSKKNRQRFTFGRVYPQGYSVARKGAEPCQMRTQCLVSTHGAPVQLEVSVRFLQVSSRDILSLREAVRDAPRSLSPGSFEVVPELVVDGQRFLTWQEAVEREVGFSPQDPSRICDPGCHLPFEFPGCENLEAIRNAQGTIVGLIRRRQESLRGEILLRAEELRPGLFKITTDVVNQSPIAEREIENQDSVLLKTLASTHTILHLVEAEFVSLMDPPPLLRELAASCKNEGTWPVLVGDEQAGDRSTMLSSPIILYDYPKIAPESPGGLFDGTEIDEILTLRMMTMTEAEKEEMRQSDPRARQILERTESLAEDQLMKLHGTWRELRSFDVDFFGASHRLEVVEVDGVPVRVGDRVKIRPKARADIMDIALAGRIATIEAIEQDAEHRIHLALVLDDDPGKDLGFMRQPGHRFFYLIDEVEIFQENR